MERLNKVPERMSLYIVVVSFQIPVSVEQRHLLQYSLHQSVSLAEVMLLCVGTAGEAEPWPWGSGSRRHHISGMQLISGHGDRRR